MDRSVTSASGLKCSGCGNTMEAKPRLVSEGRPGGAFTLCGACSHPFIMFAGALQELGPDDYRYLREQPQVLQELRAWAAEVKERNAPRKPKAEPARASRSRGARREMAGSRRSSGRHGVATAATGRATSSRKRTKTR